jgi:DNA-binding beta-propeller fold protein YncE
MIGAFGSVWVVNYRPSTVSRLDGRSGALLATIPVGADACLGMAVAGGRLWVPTCGSAELNEIDPATNTVRGRYPIPLQLGREGAFAADGEMLWIPLSAPDTAGILIGQFNIKDRKVLKRIVVPPGSDVAVAAFGSIWVVSTQTNTVLRLDGATGEVTARIPVGLAPKFSAAGFNALWVQNQGDGSVSRIDPDREEEIARIPAEAPTNGGDLAVGGESVWLSVDGKPLTRIDPSTNRVTLQYIGGSGADAARFAYDALWIADHKHGEVWRVPLARLPDP